MPQKDVSHNNVDILLKSLGNEYKDKSFAAYGLDIPKIVRFRPTDLPLIMGDERFADHVFDLADGSHAIVDYESQYRKINFVKYGNYATRVLAREMEEGKEYDLRIIVIHAGDVKSAPSMLKTRCLTIEVENVFLSNLDGDAIYGDVSRKIAAGEALNDVEQMQLIILPLIEMGTEAKRRMADKAIDIAAQIEAVNVRSFVLAGMSVAGAGFLTDEQDAKILEVLKMTRIGRMIQKEIEEKSAEASKKAREEGFNEGRNEGFNEGRDEGFNAGRDEGFNAGRNEGIIATALNMLHDNLDINTIMKYTKLPPERLAQLSASMA